MKFDVAIIGAGITGSSIAFELSKYKLDVVLIEKENDVSLCTTKANSGIVHAGYDPKPGTKMAELNVYGSKHYKKLAEDLNFHYKQIGSLVIGRDEDKALIEELYKRGIANRVEELSILNKEEIHELEPSLASDISVALLAKTAAIVSPWEVCIAMAETAVKNGVTLLLNNEVKDINKKEDVFIIETSKETIEARYVINAAGCHADDIYNTVLLKGKKAADYFDITPSKGEYYLLDKAQGKLVNHVIFQTPSKVGKGVLVSQTVHGNLIVGPNASTDVRDKDDVSTKAEALAFVREKAVLSVPSINFRENIRNFSGERATIAGLDDFVIGESKEVKNFINFAGIKSPGLSCAPSFGVEAIKILSELGLSLEKKDDFVLSPLNTYFKDLPEEEKIKKIQENKDYGQIICRCETVSLGEIKDALHRIIPATSIDGVKRRTNAGMGRCQGGFCGPKVLEIIEQELHIKPDHINQDREGSFIIEAFTKGDK